MSTLDDLEAALRAAWTPENLQVYGDHLIGLGDPRGELVSVDLHAEAHGASRDVAHRKRRALRAWLGLGVDEDLTRGVWSRVRFVNGFVEDLEIDNLARVLATPGGAFVRSIVLAGKFNVIGRALTAIAEQPRPWLRQLTILPRYQSEGRPWTSELPLLGDMGRFITCAPNLERLDIRGHRLIDELPHPTLRTLNVRGADAIRGLIEPRAPMPALVELSLGLVMFRELQPTTYDRARLPTIPADGFPALRRLDLAANEAAHIHSAVHAAAFDALNNVGVLDQLEYVRVPQLRNTQEAARLQTALDQMPVLRVLQIQRSRAANTSISHPTATIEIVPVPWPAMTRPSARGWLVLALPGRKEARWWLPSLIGLMDAFERWPERARAAWTEIWQAIESITVRETVEVSVATLRDALAPMRLDARSEYPLLAVREAVRLAIATDCVAITRAG